ncbi:3-keto-5-aminohexanoate cleavage protein [Amycolatopsis pithecellobii]|uniref:3-keto-5-aminohexanoate cleavage protein n=1 Tax=Amycolatopsis pithecellobii TaxID=664692 RepID=A0A6N7Z4U1_9PSEU|nr:3-keto-5-aminohexanoate cleavage protein [Amycolatopsis pithecellobii]MTD56489.1 3-keto-5-aminohexanoate cleavage protein [Amycolatopsis pithecellobii]
MNPPVIITCALTGGIHGKEANPNLPEQPDEIVRHGVAAAAAGAAILHIHVRNPDGTNTMDVEIFREVHDRLRAETDAVLQLTTGGSPLLPVAERIQPVKLGPEMCSLNMGLLNFFIRGEQVFFPNHRSDITWFATEMAERGIRPELEVYNSAMLEEVAHLIEQGILTPPYVVNLVLNTPTQGGMRGTPANLQDMVSRCHDLPADPRDIRINVSSMGRTQLPITTIAMAMGCNVRVGMEDNVFWARGELLRDNAQLVERAAAFAGLLQREIATPDQAREILGIPDRKTEKTT